MSNTLEPVKDTRAYLLLATFNLFSLFIYFCLLFSFAPLRPIHVMGERCNGVTACVTRLVTLIVCILCVVILERARFFHNVGSKGRL